MSEKAAKNRQHGEQMKIIGDKIIYHPNGTIALISPHKDGKPHGITKKFDENGKLVEEWFFEDGVLTLKKAHE